LISASAPEIDGSHASTNGAGFYLQAIVTGEITLGGVLTLSGIVAITFQIGISPGPGIPAAPSFISIQGAVSANIQYLGALSGSLDLRVYSRPPESTDENEFNPGVIGRVTLALQAGGIIPGVSLSGSFLLEVNLFVSSNHDRSIVTILTRGDKCTAGDSSYCSQNQLLVATAPGT